MIPTIPWRWLHRVPDPRCLLLSSTKGLFALSGPDFFAVDAKTGKATLLSEALPVEGRPVALYQDDAGAIHALCAADDTGTQTRLEWTGAAWKRKATWPARPLGDDQLFVYEPGRGLLQLEPVTQILWRLKDDQWVQEGVLDLGLKIKVKPSGSGFDGRAEGVNGAVFGGATVDEARACVLREVSCQDYLAVYEPAHQRVVALCNVRLLGVRCFELSPKLGRALPAPEVAPDRNMLSGLRTVGLAIDPASRAALLLRRAISAGTAHRTWSCWAPRAGSSWARRRPSGPRSAQGRARWPCWAPAALTARARWWPPGTARGVSRAARSRMPARSSPRRRRPTRWATQACWRSRRTG
jgi:hypothetical protein